MTPFVLRSPRSAAEAVAWLAANPQARVLAGGTDLLPNLRRGIVASDTLIDLGGIDDLQQITRDGSGWVLGAGVTLQQLAGHSEIKSALPALAQAAASVAGPSHRTVATLGGNLCLDTRCVFYNQSEWWRQSNNYCLKNQGEVCHVAPQGARCHAAWSGDLAPALIALDASIEILHSDGPRTLPLADFYQDDGANPLTLGAGELVTRVRIPAQPDGMRCGYRKARTRGAVDFPLVGVAVRVTMANGVIRELRVALTGTNSRPVLLEGCAALCKQPVTPELLGALGKLVQKQVSPMRSTVTASNYRRQVASVLAQRLVSELTGL
ncbi:MAG: 4-hydroxybenzoyl-CoA reductase subunit beta [Rhodoferax sp.]|uniref:4-hydroxybenzoyl-CoA reductase subunit beta n=1 Tax=Rhodoferax sp. TaxID=50421 RepID=UPI0026213E68|nr:4-hydroxybenzoyl-CoA reductase subunit beta [Rhodoferax sp.]MDD5333041.1 4-hydroxybenzoyl-CoA reductase subunit beta [Rhodoferax sp.]